MRSIIAAAAIAAMTATAGGAAASDAAVIDRGLVALVAKGAGGSGPLAGVALAVTVGGKIVYKGAAGCAQFAADGDCRTPMRPDTKVRVASVSKFVTSEAALALAREGRLDLDRDVSDYLGFRFRNPSYPDVPITARQLMAHVSSLRDPEEYWAVAPDPFDPVLKRDDLFAKAEAGASRAPGAFFSYANINYGVLGEVMERAAGERFDALVARRVLKPMRLDAGFNWSGVSTKARRAGATLYRVENGAWTAQTDDDGALAGTLPVFRMKDGLDAGAYLAVYKPGDNASLFSPQGGLRASVLDLAALGRRIERDAARAAPLWTFDAAAANGDAEDGAYEAFGLGVQTVRGRPAFLDGARIEGHGGEAFGLLSGLWVVRADPARGRPKDVVVAYALTGATASPVPKGAHPSFYAPEEPLMRFGLRAAEIAAMNGAREPEPFDAARDAAADIDAAFARARTNGRRVIVVFGTNQCHDSRALAATFARPDVAAALDARFERVLVDVGAFRDRNLDLAARFGVARLTNTPTVVVAGPDGRVLNADSVLAWKDASQRTGEEAVVYFGRY